MAKIYRPDFTKGGEPRGGAEEASNPEISGEVLDLVAKRFEGDLDERITFEGLHEGGEIPQLRRFTAEVRGVLPEPTQDPESQSQYRGYRERFRNFFTDRLLNAVAGSRPFQLHGIDHMTLEEKRAWADDLEERINAWERFKKSRK